MSGLQLGMTIRAANSSNARVKVGRVVPSAPREFAQPTLRTPSEARGALGTARPTTAQFGQEALETTSQRRRIA